MSNVVPVMTYDVLMSWDREEWVTATDPKPDRGAAEAAALVLASAWDGVDEPSPYFEVAMTRSEVFA